VLGVDTGPIAWRGCLWALRCSARQPDGWLEIGDGAETASKRYWVDWIVNSCGPWAVQSLERSALSSPVQLDLVSESPLLVPVPPGLSLPSEGLFVEVPESRRIAFFLPYQGELLVGTTEERQELDQPIAASAKEQQELYRLVKTYLPASLLVAEQHGRWISGLRPVVRSNTDVSAASSEAEIHYQRQLIAVYGRKWTIARLLAERLTHNAPFNGQL